MGDPNAPALSRELLRLRNVECPRCGETFTATRSLRGPVMGSLYVVPLGGGTVILTCPALACGHQQEDPVPGL
jgi:hypothetical protein